MLLERLIYYDVSVDFGSVLLGLSVIFCRRLGCMFAYPSVVFC